MEGLFKAARIQNDDLKQQAIQALTETVEVGYDTAGDYIQNVGTLTFELMENKNPDSDAIKSAL